MHLSVFAFVRMSDAPGLLGIWRRYIDVSRVLVDVAKLEIGSVGGWSRGGSAYTIFSKKLRSREEERTGISVHRTDAGEDITDTSRLKPVGRPPVNWPVFDGKAAVHWRETHHSPVGFQPVTSRIHWRISQRKSKQG